MPYKSRAQAAYFNIHKKQLEKQGVDVNEWNAASAGKHLPKHIQGTTAQSHKRSVAHMSTRMKNAVSKLLH